MNDLNLTLLILVLRVTVVLAVFGALAALLPRASAALRHTVWVLGLTAALAVPAVWSLAPALTWIPRVPTQVDVTTTLATASPPSVAVTTPEFTTAPPSPGDPTASVPLAVTAEPSATAETWPALLARRIPHIWLAGTVIMLLPVVLGTFRLALLRRSPLTTDASLLAAHQAAAGSLGLKQAPPLRTLDRPTMPLCFGFWRPTVLLPNEAATWEPNRLRSVLLHELAHIKRQDLRTQWLATVVRAVYWFHPLAWIAARQTARLREQACDDRVLNAGQAADTYAQTLLEIAARKPAPPALHAAGIAMARPGTLEGRMVAILDSARNRRLVGGRTLVLFTGAMLLLTGIAATSTVSRYAGAQPVSTEQGEITDVAGGPNYAQMSSDQLIDAVLRADEALRLASNAWTNMHVAVHSAEQKQLADGSWENWGPLLAMRFWIDDRASSRFRVDYLPRVSPWSGGSSPFNEGRLSRRWDGKRYVKIDYTYDRNQNDYGFKIAEDRAHIGDDPTIAGPTSPLQLRLWTLLNDRDAASGIRWHNRPEGSRWGRPYARLDEGLIKIIVTEDARAESAKLFSFDPKHGLRLAKIEELPMDGQTRTTYEVTAWRQLPGTPFALPAIWTTPGNYAYLLPAETVGRCVYELQDFSFFTTAAGAGDPFGVNEGSRQARFKDPATDQPDLQYRDRPSAAMPPTTVPATSTLDWRARLLAAQSHNALAFGLGPMLLETEPPDSAAALATEVWPDLATDGVRTALLKSFAFNRHPRVLDILHLGMTHPKAEVRRYADSYLQNYALRSFAGDADGYLAWHADWGDRPVKDVLPGNAEALAERMRSVTDDDRDRLADALIDLDLKLGKNKTHYPEKRQILVDAGLADEARRWSRKSQSDSVRQAGLHLLDQIETE